ncbi:hypothetical protein BASA81_001154 [Batrachochytrium salamandrivorans]|nr:hypothetical protein BASA81_001154 [Batrachochytrium salamandrivorans]
MPAATMMDIASTTHTVASNVLKRLSVALPHTKQQPQQPQSQPKPELVPPPPSKRTPTSSSPAEQQQQVIDLVCAFLDERVVQDQHLVIEQAEYVCFQGPKQPEISLRDYVIRLVKYANNFCEDEPRADSSGIRSLFMALEFLHRANAVINYKTVHRYLLVSMLVAVKYMEDFVMEGSYWGAVGGCTVPELNLYEQKFLAQLRFQCYVSRERFNQINDEFGAPFDEL